VSISKITEYLLKFRPSSEWIVNDSKLAYLPLGLDVPVSDILTEWDSVRHLAVTHRDGDEYVGAKNLGWKSLTIYGIDKHNTTTAGDGMGWTEIANQCPKTVTWLIDNFIINKETGRIRFMLLEPGGSIVLHKDRNFNKLFEVNVAITNPKGCTFRFKNYGTVPFTPGLACIMDVGYEHFVVNDSNEPRLHIIVHATLKDNTLISKSYADRYYNQ